MRRTSAIVCAVLLLGTLVIPAIAAARSLSEVKSELERVKSETAAAGRAFDHAYWAVDEAEVRIEKTDKKIAKTRAELEKAKARLGARAVNIYRRDEANYLALLVGSVSFEQFVNRAEYLRRIGASDAIAVADVKRLEASLVNQRAQLVKERKQHRAALKGLKAQRDKLQARLRAKQADYLRVKAELDSIRGGPNRPDGMAAYPGPNGMVFPVVGSYYYSNTWGASRGGGRRRHKGTDIMARRGTPVVAILPGTVSSKSGGLGGKVIYLHASNGWTFYYAHLDGWAVRSGHVRAGQIIGYVGSTGNAAGGAPHLHLQIEPHGYPVNPYPYLRQME